MVQEAMGEEIELQDLSKAATEPERQGSLPWTAAVLSIAAYTPRSDWPFLLAKCPPPPVPPNDGMPRAAEEPRVRVRGKASEEPQELFHIPGGPSLPVGWVCDLALSTYGGTAPKDNTKPFDWHTSVQMIAFRNDTTKKIMLAIKGSDNLDNFKSDFLNSGGQAWKDIEETVTRAFEVAKTRYPDYEIFFTGHSLGGGIVQTLCVKLGVNGYTQNALPISRMARKDKYLIDGEEVDFDSAVKRWDAKGYFLDGAIVDHDIATGWYKGYGGEYYLNTYTRHVAYHGKDYGEEIGSPEGLFGYIGAGLRMANEQLPFYRVTRAIDAHKGPQVVQGLTRSTQIFTDDSAMEDVLVQLRKASTDDWKQQTRQVTILDTVHETETGPQTRPDRTPEDRARGETPVVPQSRGRALGGPLKRITSGPLVFSPTGSRDASPTGSRHGSPGSEEDNAQKKRISPPSH